MRPADLHREAICFVLLRELEGTDAVLIGGYAVTAYGLPRFSVDLDLVVSSQDLESVRSSLSRRGLVRTKNWDGGGVFAGSSERWTLGAKDSKVSVDVLIDGVFDRMSGMNFSFTDLRKHAGKRTVTGFQPESRAEFMVADPESLVALKVVVGRNVDLRDIAVLSMAGLDLDIVRRLLKVAPPKIVVQNARKLLAAVRTNAFRNSLKGTYSLDEPTYTRVEREARRLGLFLEKSFTQSFPP